MSIKNPEPTPQALIKTGPIEVPKNLFDGIMGYDDVKLMTRLALQADKPTHCLYAGPPGTAKSAFLDALQGLASAEPPTPTVYLAGDTTKKAGFARFLIENLDKRVILIDEIDKMPKEDQTLLLALMEGGVLSVMNSDIQFHQTGLDMRFFASANVIDRLIGPLQDRFRSGGIFEFRPYSDEEFEEVLLFVLKAKEEESAKFARGCAKKCLQAGIREIREARGIARLASGKLSDVDTIIATRLKYLPKNVMVFRCNNKKCDKEGRLVRVYKEE